MYKFKKGDYVQHKRTKKEYIVLGQIGIEVHVKNRVTGQRSFVMDEFLVQVKKERTLQDYLIEQRDHKPNNTTRVLLTNALIERQDAQLRSWVKKRKDIAKQ